MAAVPEAIAYRQTMLAVHAEVVLVLLGAEAYSERIDCLRSGREGIAEPAGVDAELDGLPVGAADGPPKKSSPSRESEAFVGLGAAVGFCGGGLAPGVSVVLGPGGRARNITEEIDLLRGFWRRRDGMAGSRGTLLRRCTIQFGFFLHNIQRHIVITFIVQGGGIGHWTIHNPSFRLVLGPYKILNLRL